MAGPGPGEYRLLGVEPEQVGPRLPVAVPQLLPGRGPAQRTRGQLAHHAVPGRVDPDHGVGPGPDDVLHRGVVAVGDPGVTRREIRHGPPKLAGVQRLPARLMEHRVELEVRYTESGGDAPGQGGLSRPAVADHRDPLHPDSIGDDGRARRAHYRPGTPGGALDC